MEISGKLWVGPLHDKAIVGSVSKYLSRHKAARNEMKVITTMGEELDIPLYYSVPRLTMKLGIGSVSPDLVMETLKEKGFRTSKTHMKDSCIKTDAPVGEVERVIMKLWKQM